VLTHQDLPKLDEHQAFNHQLEGMFPNHPEGHFSFDTEIEKAIDNLVKSGKLYSNVQTAPILAPVPQVASRRDSVPVINAIPRSPLEATDTRMAQTMPSRHYSIHSVDNVRPSQSYANLHSYYTSQRANQRTPDDDIQLMQLKRRIALQRDNKTLPSEYSTSSGTSNTGSASSSLILDTSISGADPVHSPLALSETFDDPYSSRRRRFRLGSASFEGLSGISETDLTPRAGSQTAGIIGNRTSPGAPFDPFSSEFGQVLREQREHDRRLREQRPRGDSNPAESPSPRSATFSLFSAESTQTNSNTTASSPETSPLKTSKPSLGGPTTKIAPIGTKRSSGSLNSDNGDSARSHLQMSAPTPNAPLPSPRIATPTTNDADKWNVFSGGWGTPFAGNDSYHTHSRSATSDPSSQKSIWGPNSKGLGMTVGSGSVDVWG
jgi:hypothetical protein